MVGLLPPLDFAFACVAICVAYLLGMAWLNRKKKMNSWVLYFCLAIGSVFIGLALRYWVFDF